MSNSREKIYGYMKSRLIRFENNIETKQNTGELATLRRGIGKTPGDQPNLWGILFEGLPEDLMSASGLPSYAEWGIYTALTLYALHQQGSSASIQCDGVGIGAAVARLVENEDDRPRIARRFNAFATSNDMTEAAYHLRGLVQLLKAENISLDYAMLACELYEYQMNDENRSRIRLKWGQDFYRNTKKNNNDTED